jgi:hypothetical protein
LGKSTPTANKLFVFTGWVHGDEKKGRQICAIKSGDEMRVRGICGGDKIEGVESHVVVDSFYKELEIGSER